MHQITDELKNLLNYSDWNNKVLDKFEGNGHLFNISYHVLYYILIMLLQNQKRLGIRGYHIPQIYICSKQCYHPFIERLNDIIHSLQSAGLSIVSKMDDG